MVRAVPGFVETIVILEPRIFPIDEQQGSPAMDRLADGIGEGSRRQRSMAMEVVLQGESDLEQVPAALGSAGGLATLQA
jgi:hypothetical protein